MKRLPATPRRDDSQLRELPPAEACRMETFLNI